MFILVEASSRLLGLLGCRWLLLSWAILGLCKQHGGSRSDTLQTIVGLGSQQVDWDECLGAVEACAFYSAVASPEPLKVSGTGCSGTGCCTPGNCTVETKWQPAIQLRHSSNHVFLTSGARVNQPNQMLIWYSYTGMEIGRELSQITAKLISL